MSGGLTNVDNASKTLISDCLFNPSLFHNIKTRLAFRVGRDNSDPHSVAELQIYISDLYFSEIHCSAGCSLPAV